MIETMSTTQVSALIEAANHALVKFKYRPETIRKFNAVWNKLLIYAHTKQVEMYSVELAEYFLTRTSRNQTGKAERESRSKRCHSPEARENGRSARLSQWRLSLMHIIAKCG